MNLVNPRPPSCSSPRDESVATENASIGARTKPYAPPEVSPLRTREIHAPPSGHRPPPQIHRSRRRISVVTAAASPSSPPVTDTGDSPATRQLCRVNPVSQLGDPVKPPV
ncbi:hypothetical protein F2Q70_00042838 [Brassica cretica]|uniref:Uncharacterized protein n=1 Tax=Brassica cretica TaxID=69181 RepID=A0A8S9KEQ8_BRACR|nr:hypothetical protein F2Q70_00042838 [Brassica cretica]